jgi:hypothetical protein
LPPALLAKERSQLASVTGNTQPREDTTAQLRAKIEKETASPQSDDASVSTLQRDLQDLQALAGVSDPGIADARGRVAQAYLSDSKRMLAKAHFTESQHLLDLAKQFGLPADSYQAQASALTQARAQADADNRARENAAQLSAVKNRVIDEARADHIDVALAEFAELKKSLPATDPWLTTDAPRAIAEAYLERARRAARQARFDQALQDAQAAQQVAPNLPEIADELQLFQSARDVARLLESAAEFRTLRPQIDRVRESEGAKGSHAIAAGFLRLVAERINRVNAQNPSEAVRLQETAKPIFVNLPKAMAASVNQVTVQNQSSSQNPPVVEPSATRPSTPESQTVVQTALPANVGQRKPVASNNRTPVSQEMQTQAQTSPPAASSDQTTQVASAGPVGPCNAVTPGAAARLAFCRDALAKGGAGPEMALIPAGLELGSFAIMRNETSVADYNVYCSSTKGCTPVSGSDPQLPMVNISYDDMQKYAAWLSQATGAKYRVPTRQEWIHAAGGRNKTDPDANCVVPGRDPRGTSLRAAGTGNANLYGLHNMFGNAQELVTTVNAGLLALGGAVGDELIYCQSEYQRKVNGEPDGRTGFRLLREMR